METYFDSRLDLLQRNLAKTSDRLKMRAEETLNELKKDVFRREAFKVIPSPNQQLERELQRYKLKVSAAPPDFKCLYALRVPRTVPLATQVRCEEPSCTLTCGTTSWRRPGF